MHSSNKFAKVTSHNFFPQLEIWKVRSPSPIQAAMDQLSIFITWMDEWWIGKNIDLHIEMTVLSAVILICYVWIWAGYGFVLRWWVWEGSYHPLCWSQALPPQASAWARIVVGFPSLALAGAHQPGLLEGWVNHAGSSQVDGFNTVQCVVFNFQTRSNNVYIYIYMI